MANFTLTDTNGKFTLDTSGNVSDSNGHSVGTWDTDIHNHLIIQRKPDAEGTLPPPFEIHVKWIFNKNNQFCLLDKNGAELLNFNADNAVFPEYELRNAVLRVKPDMRKDFQFFIRADWEMTQDHLLKFTVKGETSVIDGFLADSKSRFIYNFRDKKRPFLSSRLTFTGHWEQKTVGGVPKMKFVYHSFDDTEKSFDLPGGLVITKGTNQLKYAYDKDSKSFGVTFIGFLKINENLSITYSLDKQSSTEGDELVATTTFTMQAAFSGNQFDGDLNLVLLKDDNSPGNYGLAVTGEYTGVVGDTQVMVGFRFSQMRSNGKVTRTVGIGGAFIFKNGQLGYKLAVGETMVNLTIGLEIRLKQGVSVDSKLNLMTENGQVQSVSFLLGVSF